VVSDNGVLNGLFIAKKEEVSEGWNQLRNKKIYDLYNLLCNLRIVK